MLDLLLDIQTSFFSLPAWLNHLLLGVMLVYMIALGGFVLARLGYSPLWILTLLIPILSVIMIWVLAYAKWPRLALTTPSTPPVPDALTTQTDRPPAAL